MTAPYLSQFTKAANVVSQMVRAAKEAVTHSYGADIKEALSRTEKEGFTAPHEIYQLMAESRVGMGKRIWLRNLTKTWGAFFSFAEQFNRVTTFIAAYRIAQSNGMGENKAYAFARKAVEETQGVYNRGNRPNWARGKIGAPVMTFKQFSIAYLEFVRRLPRKQKLIALAILMMGAGIQGLPFREDLEDIIDTIGQWLGFATHSDKNLKKAVINALGEDAGKFVLYGVSALPGIPLDIQGRLGLHNLIPGTALLKPSEKAKGREATEMLGPVGGLAQAAGQAMESMVKGQPGEAIKTIIPKAAQNALKGLEMWTTGEYRDTRGRLITKNVTETEAVVKAIGFQPERIAQLQRSFSTNIKDIEIQRVKEDELAGRWARAIVDRDKEEARKIRKELTQWNLKNPAYRVRIDRVQLRRRIRELRMSKSQRFLRSTPREMRREIREELMTEQ